MSKKTEAPPCDDTTPTPAPTTTYLNGMSTPDEIGRVKLEAVEKVRAINGQKYIDANAPLPAFAFVRAEVTTFSLDEVQDAHVVMNTGDSARMRNNIAYKIVTDQQGQLQVGDALLDTFACVAEDPMGAALEIVKAYDELAAGTESPAYPDSPE